MNYVPFKLNPITAACAMALGLVAGPALAAGPAAFDTPQVEVYLTGASAPDNILGGITNKFFDAAHPIHKYQDDNGTPANFADDGKAYTAYFGQVKVDPAINSTLHGKSARLIKRSRGGSVWGVNPVARADAIANLKINSTDCVLNTGIYRCPQQGSDAVQNNAANRVPDFGVSDVEPTMFKDTLNVEFGASQLTAAEAARFDGTQFGVSSLMMGLVATDNVPHTLKLSTADYGAMLSGLIGDWSSVGDGSVTGPVVVCRRVQGSGTQASYNWYFNNFPCTRNWDSGAGSGNTAPKRMADSASFPFPGAGTPASPFLINPAVGYTVVENPGSGNVADCLKNAQANVDHNFTGDDGKSYRVQFSNAGVDKAMGVLSLDSLDKESGWSFRALNGAGRINPAGAGSASVECTNADQKDCGIFPTKANHREGAYEFAVELSMQYRNATVSNSGNPASCVGDPTCQNVATLDPLKKAFADDFIKFTGDPDILNTLAVGPRDATIALPISYDPTVNTNVAKATRFGNTCSPLQKLI